MNSELQVPEAYPERPSELEQESATCSGQPEERVPGLVRAQWLVLE